MLKSAYLLLLAGLPSFAYANCEAQQCCDPFVPPAPIESCEVPVGYFYPAQYRFGDCGIDISLAGEFIYWEVNRDSTSSVGTKIEPVNNGAQLNQTVLVHYQGYRPGFKIAAGIGLPGCDAWKMDVQYTWFHHTSTNNFRTSANGFIQQSVLPALLNPLLFAFQANTAKSVLKFDLDFLQATVGRPFYLSQRLIINVGAGLKSWWSALDSNLDYTALNGSQIRLRSKSGLWGIGPYFNAQIKGLLWCGTYIYGTAGVWPTYTRYNKIKGENSYPAFPQFQVPAFNGVVTIQKSVYTTQLMYEGSAGIGWGSYLCNCNYHVDFLIGYDMMTNYIKAIVLPLTDPHYEFYYQGLFVKAQFDF